MEYTNIEFLFTTTTYKNDRIWLGYFICRSEGSSVENDTKAENHKITLIHEDIKKTFINHSSLGTLLLKKTTLVFFSCVLTTLFPYSVCCRRMLVTRRCCFQLEAIVLHNAGLFGVLINWTLLVVLRLPLRAVEQIFEFKFMTSSASSSYAGVYFCFSANCWKETVFTIPVNSKTDAD